MTTNLQQRMTDQQTNDLARYNQVIDNLIAVLTEAKANAAGRFDRGEASYAQTASRFGIAHEAAEFAALGATLEARGAIMAWSK